MARDIRRRKKAEKEQARLDALLAAVVDEVVPVQEPSDSEPGNEHAPEPVLEVPEPDPGPSVPSPSEPRSDPVVESPGLAAGPSFASPVPRAPAAPSTAFNTPASEIRRQPTPRRFSAPTLRLPLAPPVFPAAEPLVAGAAGAAGAGVGDAGAGDVSDDELDMADSMPMTWSAARGAYSVDKFLQDVQSWQMLRKSQA